MQGLRVGLVQCWSMGNLNRCFAVSHIHNMQRHEWATESDLAASHIHNMQWRVNDVHYTVIKRER